MPELHQLFENNAQWAKSIKEEDPEFFEKLAKQQEPEYLWIGCSDARVPANEIVGMLPGDLFVHRNVGNVVLHTDLNCLSSVQYAVDVLKVKHILVTGHYGCGGVKAAMSDKQVGITDAWIRTIRDLYFKHYDELSLLPTEEERVDRLCELNVIEQVVNVCRTTIVNDAWDRGQKLMVHGWVYSLKDGRVRAMGIDVGSREELEAAYQNALSYVPRQGPRD